MRWNDREKYSTVFRSDRVQLPFWVRPQETRHQLYVVFELDMSSGWNAKYVERHSTHYNKYDGILA